MRFSSYLAASLVAVLALGCSHKSSLVSADEKETVDIAELDLSVEPSQELTIQLLEGKVPQVVGAAGKTLGGDPQALAISISPATPIRGYRVAGGRHEFTSIAVLSANTKVHVYWVLISGTEMSAANELENIELREGSTLIGSTPDMHVYRRHRYTWVRLSPHEVSGLIRTWQINADVPEHVRGRMALRVSAIVSYIPDQRTTVFEVFGAEAEGNDQTIVSGRPVVEYPEKRGGTLINGTQPLYEFSVKAEGGDVAIRRMTFTVNSSGVQLSDCMLRANDRTIWTGDCKHRLDVNPGSLIEIAGGNTVSLVLEATVINASAGDFVAVTLMESDQPEEREFLWMDDHALYTGFRVPGLAGKTQTSSL